MDRPLQNPYAPPAGDDEVPSPVPEQVDRRSAVPLVFGILSITFSSVLLVMMLFGTCSAVIGTITNARRDSKRAQIAEREPPHASSPASVAVTGVYAVLIALPMPVALLVIGIGQVRYRRWALRATRVWSLCAIGLCVGHILYAAIARTEVVNVIPLTILLLPYPVLLLIFFARRRTVASMNR